MLDEGIASCSFAKRAVLLDSSSLMSSILRFSKEDLRLLQVDSIDCTSFPATDLLFGRRCLSLGADVRRTCLIDAIDRLRSMECPTGIDPLGVIFTGDTGDSVKDTGAVDVVGMNPLSSCFIVPSRLSILLPVVVVPSSLHASYSLSFERCLSSCLV